MRRIVGVAVGLAVLGCRTETTILPQDPVAVVAGDYVLFVVNGMPMPYSFPPDSLGCVQSITRGSMSLQASTGNYNVILDDSNRCPNVGGVGGQGTESGKWSWDGTTVRFAPKDGPGSGYLDADPKTAIGDRTLTVLAEVGFAQPGGGPAFVRSVSLVFEK